MKILTSLLVLFLLLGCASEEKYADQPTAPWTYPILEYRAVQVLVGRTSDPDVARLVGWDDGFYYFDWSQKEAIIGRGTGRVDRKQFDIENGGALTLKKGRVTLEERQIRTLAFE